MTTHPVKNSKTAKRLQAEEEARQRRKRENSEYYQKEADWHQPRPKR